MLYVLGLYPLYNVLISIIDNALLYMRISPKSPRYPRELSPLFATVKLLTRFNSLFKVPVLVATKIPLTYK